MLCISIPSGEQQGDCKVNGKPCEFRVVGREFWFRAKGDAAGEWDKRAIIHSQVNGALTNYACGNAQPIAQPASGHVADIPMTIGKSSVISRPSHQELQKLVLDHEDLLVECWSRHENEGDILILGDVRRPEVAEMAREQLGPDAVHAEIVGSQRVGVRPMLAMLQPKAFVDAMPSTGDFAHREAAKELRSFAQLQGLGIVPLLVVYQGGLWATQWASPGSKATVIRYEPSASAEAN